MMLRISFVIKSNFMKNTCRWTGGGRWALVPLVQPEIHLLFFPQGGRSGLRRVDRSSFLASVPLGQWFSNFSLEGLFSKSAEPHSESF